MREILSPESSIDVVVRRKDLCKVDSHLLVHLLQSVLLVQPYLRCQVDESMHIINALVAAFGHKGICTKCADGVSTEGMID